MFSDTRIGRDQHDRWVFEPLDRSQAYQFDIFQVQGSINKINLIKPEVRLRSQNKSASLEKTFSAENLQQNYNRSGYSFRPDVLCDVEGKLRNWRKGSRLKKE